MEYQRAGYITVTQLVQLQACLYQITDLTLYKESPVFLFFVLLFWSAGVDTGCVAYWTSFKLSAGLLPAK